MRKHPTRELLSRCPRLPANAHEASMDPSGTCSYCRSIPQVRALSDHCTAHHGFPSVLHRTCSIVCRLTRSAATPADAIISSSVPTTCFISGALLTRLRRVRLALFRDSFGLLCRSREQMSDRHLHCPRSAARLGKPPQLEPSSLPAC